MSNPHIVAIPLPAQGHVIPLLELSQCLVEQGIKVTFVNSDFNHKRVLNALANKDYSDQIRLVSIPDGLESWDDRNDLSKLTLSIVEVMPKKLEDLIERINSSEEDGKVSCVIADVSMGWAVEVAEKLGIPRVTFWPASAASLCLVFSIPKLVDDGIINEDGTPVKQQMINLAPRMPSMNTADFMWSCIGDLSSQRIVFNAISRNNKFTGLANWTICNSIYDLEPGAFVYYPNIIPIGPLLARNRQGNPMGNFWPEDSTCLKWLDQQPPNSVIYVAFGSFTIFNQTQFRELALGLELSNQPFLWVVRPDLTSSETNEAYPDGFLGRVANRGLLVGWAPQQKVLGHPSIACFISHCGWNSTMEGAGNGVPFLCWPYFADQLLNESYICDVWKVGLRFERNENGIITREEVKKKVEQVGGDQEIKKWALELKKTAVMSVSEGGQSTNNFRSFVEWFKESNTLCRLA